MEIFKSLGHPEELYALIKYKFGGGGGGGKKGEGDANHFGSSDSMSPNLKKCYYYLSKTSRSFSAVIQALDDELRDAVCLFYLVLRALDTVEDDMTIPNDEKVHLLKQFYTYLEDPSWNYQKSNEKDKAVLEDFTTISAEFRSLKPVYREVITDICRRMGNGMTVFLTQSPDSLQEWDEYCHYVAGLVGIGLSRLFSASQLEDATVGDHTALSNSMGLFLQKTNIIRDILEDVLQGRHFWPKEVWGKYSRKLVELVEPEMMNDAVSCLNQLITNALMHIPDVMKYLSCIHNQSIFNFCAIPQVMAIATLERCYNNKKVFSGVVKIRKGEALRLINQANNLERVKAIFSHFLKEIERRIPRTDPSADKTRQVVKMALSTCETVHVYNSSSVILPAIYLSFMILLLVIVYHYWTTFSDSFASCAGF